jgi:4'-phosphopantetheinyl transferase
LTSPTPVTFDQPGPSTWALGDNIHIWKFPAIENGSSLLTPSEKEIAGRFRFAGDRNRFAVGRHALRLLLSKYLSVPPEEISIVAQKGQKPFVSSPPCDIRFNISHSGDWVLIVFANEEIGIDVEKINPDFNYNDVLGEHFSDAEKAFISGNDNPVSSFYYLWTRKEALTKARGRGLGENLIVINTLGGLLELNKKTWRLESFEIPESYHAAIAYSAELKNPVYFDGASLL